MKRLSFLKRSEMALHPLAKQLYCLMERKKSNLAMAADVTHAEKLLHLADLLGPHLCILKTHIDILEDFTPSVIDSLKTLSKKHDFLLFEDRKFADIGNTVKYQYTKGLYRISEWAHLINVHTLPGPGILKGLGPLNEDRGVLFIAEMSSDNHLFTKEYTSQTLAIAEAHPESVLGFITQHALSPNPQWLYLTPGIQFSKKSDELMQRYITPEEAILNQGTDIMIVGRGILEAENILYETKRYQKAGWDAYLKSL